MTGTDATGGATDGTGQTDLDRALAVLDTDVEPGRVVAASRVTALVIGVATLLAAVERSPLVLVPGLSLAVGGALVVRRLPRVLADARRTASLGAAPALVGRAVLHMRLVPTAERAAAFAARRADGPLADSLADHTRRARGTPASGLAAFGERWGREFPALRRATALVEAAGSAPPGERERTLDRANAAVLDGTRERMADAAASLQGPVTALYAFGVLLPLALVAVLPAARVAGLPVTLPVVVALYDVALPLLMAGASAWVLARRPVTFPPTPVPRDHPDVPSRRWPALALGAAVAAGGWVAAPLVLPPWFRSLVAVGFGSGVALLATYRPVVAVRERVAAVEDGLADALYLVGRRVGEGVAVETAVERAAPEVAGPMGEVLAAAARRGRQLRVGVGEAFGGEYGALAAVPSARVESATDLLAVAAREGRPAGVAIVAMADHVEEARRVERSARRDLRQVTTTLSNTAAVFGPLVAGVTVALAGAMGGRNLGALGAGSEPAAAGATALPTAALGTAVGAYALLLAAALTALATGLERGFDRPQVGYRVGGALCAATALFALAYRVGGALA
ncbi:type II secretion system protein [Halomarina litorea]|uniref:type II secretion system protein n=1 Tax=Halomarina litorea TaxID=2961595 RepID=UPI0020C53C6C|nr:type II secretion system protein [Halomarina sp. BCD28]